VLFVLLDRSALRPNVAGSIDRAQLRMAVGIEDVGDPPIVVEVEGIFREAPGPIWGAIASPSHRRIVSASCLCKSAGGN